MVKPLAIVVLLLSVFVAVPLSSANTDPIETACSDSHLRLTHAVPPDLLEFACTVYDTGSPVNNEFRTGDEVGPDSVAYSGAIQESGLPEKTRQLLLVLLALWSQG